MPREALPHTVEVNYGAVAAAHSPYRVYVRSPPDLSKLIIWGNWFDKEATVHKAMSFTVDATSCGEGALEVHVTHEASKTEIPVKIINSNNVYTVEVIPTRPGKYITNLIYGGFEVPVVKNVFVDSIVDVSKVVVQSVKTSKHFYDYDHVTMVVAFIKLNVRCLVLQMWVQGIQLIFLSMQVRLVMLSMKNTFKLQSWIAPARGCHRT